MNIRWISFFVFFCFLFVACRTSNEDELIKDHKNEISMETAYDIVSNYLVDSRLSVQTRSANPLIDESTSFTLYSIESYPVMHIVNIINGGFMVISADNRIDPLLAYSDKGHINIDDFFSETGIDLWAEHYKELIDYLYKYDINTIPDLENYWNRMATRSVQPEFGGCDENDLYWHYQAPLIETQWYGDDGFRDSLDLIFCDEDLKHAYACSASVAIAQIMNFHNYPTSFNWSQMEISEPTPECSRLLKAITDTISSREPLNKTCLNTTVSLSLDKGEVLRAFGYSHSIQEAFNYVVVEREILNNRRPVLVSGKNNYFSTSWICDGINEYTFCTDDTPDAMMGHYLFFHADWGFRNSNCNGWFTYSNFNYNGGPFNKKMQMVYNIY